MNSIILCILLTSTIGLIVGTIAATFAHDSFALEGNNTNATLTAPILKDPVGKVIAAPAQVNKMVIISTTLTSNSSNSSSSSNSTNDDSIPFMIVVEARDELGITHYSQFALGSLNLDGSASEVGLSWIPEEAGTYELRAFALSDWNNPQILAPAQRSLTSVEQ